MCAFSPDMGGREMGGDRGGGASAVVAKPAGTSSGISLPQGTAPAVSITRSAALNFVFALRALEKADKLLEAVSACEESTGESRKNYVGIDVTDTTQLKDPRSINQFRLAVFDGIADDGVEAVAIAAIRILGQLQQSNSGRTTLDDAFEALKSNSSNPQFRSANRIQEIFNAACDQRKEAATYAINLQNMSTSEQFSAWLEDPSNETLVQFVCRQVNAFSNALLLSQKRTPS